LRSPALGIDSVLIFVFFVFRWHLVHAEDPRSGGDYRWPTRWPMRWTISVVRYGYPISVPDDTSSPVPEMSTNTQAENS
jgi:hypothetical protein